MQTSVGTVDAQGAAMVGSDPGLGRGARAAGAGGSGGSGDSGLRYGRENTK